MTSPSSDYDVIIVGAGMFGSSAAKHLRRLDKDKKLRICIIGPDVNTHELCRGQHFDEARICRRVETVSPWAPLNNDGVSSYAETERESGIRFFVPCGVVWVAPPEDKAAVAACMHKVVHDVADPQRRPFHFYDNFSGNEAENAENVAKIDASNAKVENFLAVLTSASEAERQFGQHISVHQFAVPGTGEAHEDTAAAASTYYIVEKGPNTAGTVHPTRYVEAQLACAKTIAPTANFTHLSREVVTAIERISPADAAPRYAVRTDTGASHTADKVLVATAAFASYHNLIPKPAQKMFCAVPEHVVLLRVNPPGTSSDANHSSHDETQTNTPRPEDVAESERLPAVIRTTGGLDDQFYCLPPRYYAEPGMEGWFIKLGGLESHDMAIELERAEERARRAAAATAAVAAATASDANEAEKLHEVSRKRSIHDTPYYDVSNLKAAMDWYEGRTTLHGGTTAKLAAMLSTVYPKWQLVNGGRNDEKGDASVKKNFFSVRCIWDLTMDCGPVIDQIPDNEAQYKGEAGASASARAATWNSGLFVALGGNGRGAKACDPIGRLAAWKVLYGGAAPLPEELSYYEGLYKATY